MREEQVSVTFQPSGRTAFVLPGTRLLEAAVTAGLTLNLPCGGEGTCGKCRVRVREGADAATPREAEVFSPQQLQDGWRLACLTKIVQDAVVEVPRTSLLESHHKILAELRQTSRTAAEPNVRKKFVQLSSPQRGDDAPDMIRLERSLENKDEGPLAVEMDLLRGLPQLLRRENFQGTAVMLGRELIDFEPGNTQRQSYSVAVDLGTTTIVAMLLDLARPEAEPMVVARLNPQTAYGDDVLSRILHARENASGLNDLHETIVSAVEEMIGELAAEAGVERQRIYEIVLSGNTTMQQLFCRIDPSSLGEIPFVPASGRGLQLPAARAGLCIHPRGRLHVMPVIGGFVGGDTVAGILACELADAQRPALFVDIGTNGEIVLAHNGRLTAASTAAGPAFEGARISQGMRATGGAIEKVVVENCDGGARLRLNVIGNMPPLGLCGSALIDLAAELLRHGVLSPQGRLLRPEQLPDELDDDLRRRLVADGSHMSFILASSAESGLDRPVIVTQADFRELQLAAGAIRAGVVILLRRVGVTPAELDRVLIAGGFGNFIRRANAQRIGLLPPEVPHSRVLFQGNTSLAGARLAAVSRRARAEAERIARDAEHVDLSCDEDFQTAFADAMIFPDEQQPQGAVRDV